MLSLEGESETTRTKSHLSFARRSDRAAKLQTDGVERKSESGSANRFPVFSAPVVEILETLSESEWMGGRMRAFLPEARLPISDRLDAAIPE